MSIANMSLLKDATAGSVTGGTAMALSSDGVEVKNGVHLADAGEPNFLIRTNMSLRTRNPARQSDGTYTKGKRWYTIITPKIIADGTTVFNLSRHEIEIHPETTDAEIDNILYLAAQVFTDADLTSFHKNGSLA
jgi:hypothetical protein